MRAGDGAEASETGYTQVRGGPHGETTWNRYDNSETGDVQVGRLSRVEARQVLLADRVGCRLSLRGDYDGGKGEQGELE